MTNPTKSAMDVYREISSIRFQKQPHDSSYEAATVIDQALQAAREEERAAVVAWLRNDASAAWGEACDGMEEMSWCIDAIERGDHYLSALAEEDGKEL